MQTFEVGQTFKWGRYGYQAVVSRVTDDCVWIKVKIGAQFTTYKYRRNSEYLATMMAEGKRI
jgi:hypothetical protein